jgi:phosphohistidine swiveling domain-containing protein
MIRQLYCFRQLSSVILAKEAHITELAALAARLKDNPTINGVHHKR